MRTSAVSDAEFIELFRTLGPLKTARIAHVDERNVFRRRNNLEKKLGVQILGPRVQYERAEPKAYPHRANLDVPNGIVIVASDAHYWPGPASLMHKALVSAIKEHKPKIVIMNGDVVDAPTISRHARIGWEERPALVDEIENAKERMWEIEKAAGRAEKIWCLGNHDCLDLETECLTKRGWLKHSELLGDDLVLSKEGDDAVWSPINDIVDFPFDGELICVDKLRFSMAVTPNHRVLLKKNNYESAGDEQYFQASNLPSSFDIPIYRSRFYTDTRGTFRLWLSRNQNIRVERKEIFKKKYKGKVWCLRVPLGNFMVRRKGTAYFTGNSRYETRLANVAPEYARIHGMSLQDHFSLWRPAWSCWLNDSVVVKHRWKGGIHAPYNNTVYAGKTMVTGHLHSARVTPFTDYNGTRYGVDTGCIAETDHKAFVDYTEDSPKNWRSAFGVFTFKDGQILYPELVTKWDDERVQFRGWVGKP